MGGKTSTSSQTVSIPPEVLARYNAVNSRAEDAASTQFKQYSTDPNAFVAPLTESQQSGIKQTMDASGQAQPYYQAATGYALNSAQAVNPSELGSQQINKYMSPYLSNVVNAQAAVLNQQNQQQQAGQMGQAIRSGAFGGDRSGIAAANLAQQQNLANSQIFSNLLNQGYGQALSTAQQQQGVQLSADQANRAAQAAASQQLAGLGAGAQAANLQGAQAKLAAGQTQQQTEQAGKTALYNQFLQQQSYPFQVAQFLANIAEGTGALSGSTTTTQQPGGFFSDERLKENIHPIGKTHDGQNIYRYNYKGEPDTRIGLLAQEVEHKHPEAVGLAGGYKTVDYDKATRNSSMGGGVHPENVGEGFADGGMPYPEQQQKLDIPNEQNTRELPKAPALEKQKTGFEQAMDVAKVAAEIAAVAAASGGRINGSRGHYADGGMPYSGSQGLDIPNQQNTQQLKTSGPLQDNPTGFQNLLGVASLAGNIASVGNFFKNAGGPVEGLARGHFAAGGEPTLPGLSAADYGSMLQAQAQMFGPFGQAGMYGGAPSGAPHGGVSGYVPQGNLPVSHLATAGALPTQTSPLEQMTQVAELGKDTAEAYKGYQEWKAKRDAKKAESSKSEATAHAHGGVAGGRHGYAVDGSVDGSINWDDPRLVQQRAAAQRARDLSSSGLNRANAAAPVEEVSAAEQAKMAQYARDLATRRAASQSAASAAQSAGAGAASAAPAPGVAGAASSAGAAPAGVAGASATGAGEAGFMARNFPTFARAVPAAGRLLGKYAPVGEIIEASKYAGTTPLDVQESSRLAQMGLMKPDESSAFKTRLAAGLGTVEGALPTAWFYETPADKAQKLSKERQTASITASVPKNEADFAAKHQEAMRDYYGAVNAYGKSSREAADAKANVDRIESQWRSARAVPAPAASSSPPAQAPAQRRPASAAPPTSPPPATGVAGGEKPAEPPAAGVAAAAPAPAAPTPEQIDAASDEVGTRTGLVGGETKEVPSKALFDPTKKQSILERARSAAGDLKAEQVIPFLTGLAAMGTAPTRSLGVALASGVGAGAKSYLPVKAAMADIQGAQIENAENMAKLGIPPTGDMIQLSDGSMMNRRVYMQRVMQGNAPETMQQRMQREVKGTPAAQGATPPAAGQVPGTADQVPGAAGQAPGAAGQMAPISRPEGSPFSDATIKQANSDYNSMITMTEPEIAAVNQRNEEASSAISEAAAGARSQGQLLTQLAREISSIPENSPLSGGYFQNFKSTAINALNDIAKTVGNAVGVAPDKIPQIGSSEDLNAAAVREKLNSVLMFAKSHGANQNSLGALEAALATTPGKTLTRDQAMAVISSLMIDKQHSIDEERYVRDYRNLVGATANPNLYRIESARSQYRRDYSEDNYAKSQTVLNDILNSKSPGMPELRNKILSGQLTDEEKKKLDVLIEKHYGIKDAGRFIWNY